jgi:hypothetical protein
MVRRVMDAATAKLMSGLPVPDVAAPIVAPQPEPEHPVWIIDEDSSEVIGIITRLPDDRLRELRSAVTGVEMYATGVGRAKLTRAYAPARTFGWAPRKPNAKMESCHATTLDRDFPTAATVLNELAGQLGNEFRAMMPDRARFDEAVVRTVKDDWLLDPDALWTSGVINKSAQLPYHQDGSNFHTWSAMPTLRYATRGGRLHLPEYDFCFPCRDGEVTWFCGRDLVHGVTPMRTVGPNAYRYSIVYYALAGMVDCRTWAEEQAYGRRRRAEREQDMATRVRDEQAVQ